MPIHETRPIRVFLMLLALAGSARAQIVVGTVRDGGGQPVPLVHVFAVDSSAAGVSVGTMSDAAGRYLLQVGARLPFVSARRLGYAPERSVPLDWKGADTVRVDLVLRALPYELPTVYVGSNLCLRADSLPAQSEVRRLWDGAVSTIAAREAFLNAYRYTVYAHHEEGRPDSLRAYDTTFVHEPPSPPLPRDMLSTPLAIYRGPSFWHRGFEMRLRSPGDRLLMHPQFFKRFCFDDRVTDAGDGMTQITFVERGRAQDEVEVTGTMTFKAGLPGPSRVAWDYVIKGKTIGHSEQIFELTDVNGTSFPLVTMQSLGSIDPRTGVRAPPASVRLRYGDFTPLSGR